MTAQVHVNMFYVQRNLCEIVRVHVYMHTAVHMLACNNIYTHVHIWNGTYASVLYIMVRSIQARLTMW